MPKQDVLVELFYDGAWNVVPAYARDPITITRGKGNEQAGLTPATLQLTVDNRAGGYNPRNPASPLYGLAGRNTPIRITLDGTDSRFVGEVASWAPRRTPEFVVGANRGDAWVEVEASGVLRRLGQGTDPRSALYRALSVSNPLAYYPMEDGEDSNRAASGIVGGPQMYIQSGVINFEPDGGPPGSAGYAEMIESPTDVLSVTLPSYTDTGGWQISVWCKGIAATGISTYDEVTILAVYTSNGDRFALGLANGVAGNGGLFGGGMNDAATAQTPGGLDGQWHLLQLVVEQVTATTVDLTLYGDGKLIGVNSGVTGSGIPRVIRSLDNINQFIEALEIGVAHIAVHPTDVLVSQWEPGRGWPGETAAGRISGLASERGVTLTLIGNPADCQAMGPQYPDTTTNLLAEAELTDSGMLFDSRDQVGLTYRTGPSLYTQTPALELNYAAGQLAPPFNPVLDDQATRNDVTANRREGSSARAVQETGPMNVQDPTDDPQGVGRTVGTVDVNPATDTVLQHHAGWHLHFGTVDEIRYPRVTVQALDNQPGLIEAAGTVDIGDVITIANLPADLSPDLARLIVLGYTEVIESHARRITFNCAPASPYDIGFWNETPSPTSTRWGSDGSTTAAPITTGTSTSLSVAVAAGHTLWTTNPAHFPLDINLAGARVRVTNIAGGSSPQTFTISTTVVNGVAKTIPAGTPVRLWQPTHWGL